MRPSVFLFFTLGLAAPGVLAQDRRIVPVDNQSSGRRLALVMGNQTYARKPLVNSVNDATDMAAAVRDQLGFTTTIVTNADLQTMERSMERFFGLLKPGDVALFYYSGHGMQVNGENYLLPVDFNATDEIDVKYKAYPASRLRDRLRGRGVQISILILDACRDNPYRSWRSEGGGGLAGMGGSGAFIAFAADEGKTADDNPSQRNGLFTKHLLTALREPGLTIDEVFNHVREHVYRESQGRQTPFTYSGVIGTFRFRAAAPAPPPAPTLDLDVERYQAVKDSRDPAQLEAAAAKMRRADLAEILRERAKALRSTTAPVQQSVDTKELTKQADAAFAQKNYARAFELYRQLSDRGDSWGSHRLAYLYDVGNGVAQNYESARTFYRKAADAGQIDAMYNLALIYKNGKGIATDQAQAAYWFRKAADGGDTDAMIFLGRAYKQGVGVPQDDKQAVALFRKAADKGDTTGMFNLGVMYRDGKGVDKNPGQAVALFSKAAELGQFNAMASMGEACEDGFGVPRDFKLAADWYRKAAGKGSSAGMNNLGALYETGNGVPKDIEQAVYWYKKADAAGSESAKTNLKRLGR